jgi:hypothetical protein
MNVLVVYGSGASFDSKYTLSLDGGNNQELFSPPMDKNFFNTEIITKLLSRDDYYALKFFRKTLFPLKEDLSLEEFWTAVSINLKQCRLGTYGWRKEYEEYSQINYGSSYPYSDLEATDVFSGSRGNICHMIDLIYSSRKVLGDCERDLKKLIYNCFSTIYPQNDICSNYESIHNIIQQNTGVNFLGYITFNYDLLLEQSLKKLEKQYHYLSVNVDIFDKYYKNYRPSILILKLHGSLNWKLNSRDNDIIFKEKSVKPAYPVDSTIANLYVEPGIVPPTILKEEINSEYNESNPLKRLLINQWKYAIQLLSKADKVIIVGYSFPETDYHVHRIFQIANMIRRRNGVENQKILYCVGNYNLRELKRLSNITQVKTEDIKIYEEFSKLINSRILKKYLKE